MLNRIHHTAIICSDYQKSKVFYVEVLGLEIINEIYREDRQYYKFDSLLNSNYVIELFSFQNPSPRLSNPEVIGLRHLAFEVDNLEKLVDVLKQKHVEAGPIRTYELKNKRLDFVFDPNNLPIELYGK